MQSHFIPLATGTEFRAKIRFHNLRPLEIGAIISALTLNDSKETFHNLGYAKPLGYGRVKVSELNLCGLTNEQKHYAEKFQIEMLARYGKSWKLRVNELLTMGSLQDNDINGKLEYNDLKDFQEIKNSGFYLQSYSEIGKSFNYQPNFQDAVESRVEEIEKAKKQEVFEIKKLEEEIEELKRKKEYEEALNSTLTHLSCWVVAVYVFLPS